MTTVTCVLPLAVPGCAKQQTSAETQADVAKAQAEGAKDAAKAQNEAGEKVASADADLDKAKRDSAKDDTAAIHDVTIAEAKAAHKVGIERCEAQLGDARKACKRAADIHLAAAKARAEAIKENSTGT